MSAILKVYHIGLNGDNSTLIFTADMYYSRTCYEQPPLWHWKSGILRQVLEKIIFNPIESLTTKK